MDGSYCWLSPGMLAMPTMSYYVTVSGAKLPTVSDWSNTKNQAWRDVALLPPLSAGPAGLAGAASAAATERLCYRAAAGYMFVCEGICICVVSEGA